MTAQEKQRQELMEIFPDLPQKTNDMFEGLFKMFGNVHEFVERAKREATSRETPNGPKRNN